MTMGFSRLHLLTAAGLSGGVHLAALGMLGTLGIDAQSPPTVSPIRVFLLDTPAGQTQQDEQAAQAPSELAHVPKAMPPSVSASTFSAKPTPVAVSPIKDQPVAEPEAAITLPSMVALPHIPKPLAPPLPLRSDGSGPSSAELIASETGAPSSDGVMVFAGSKRTEPIMTEVQYRQPPRPVYPAQARRLGEQGQVRLKVRVGTDGIPTEVMVMESSGSTRLDDAAMQAVRAARFEPLHIDGVPQVALAIVPIRYSLQ